MFRASLSALLLLALSVSTANAGDKPELNIDVQLSPAGSFKAHTQKVKGYVTRTSGGFKSNNVEIDLKSLTTGVSLRDKHTKERLMVEKYPKAKLVTASGKNGSGKAEIFIKGKKVKVTGSYKEEGKFLEATFDMKLSDLEITDVSYMGIGVKDKVTVSVLVPIKK